MLLLIDNYDSFTYNLVHLLGSIGHACNVVRNDEMSAPDLLKAQKPDHILLSPGPCTPAKAGVCLELTKAAAEAKIPLFGVCLGHQTIGEAFGGTVIRHSDIVHGKLGQIHHDNSGVFKDLPNGFNATRYHSLVVEKESLPSCLEVTAWLEDGTIMGLRHKELPIEGVQFHPESITSEHGKAMMESFFGRVKETEAA